MEELEAARDAVIHRLGNLTLTSGALNSSLSNNAWSVKGPGLHSHSLLMLNAEVSALPQWDVDDINRRSYALAEEVCRLWPSASGFGTGRAETVPLWQILRRCRRSGSTDQPVLAVVCPLRRSWRQGLSKKARRSSPFGPVCRRRRSCLPTVASSA